MKNKDFYKKALLLAIPMMVQNAITNMVGMVDNIMVGSIGTEPMSGVSIVNQLLFVFNLAIFGGLSGPGIYTAQFYGQNNQKGVQDTFRIKIIIAISVVIAGLLIFITNGDALIKLYLHEGSDGLNINKTLEYAGEYMGIMLISLLFFALTQVYASTLRETGETVMPMVAGIVSVFIDVIGNYLLIFGNLGLPRLGVRGAALATVFARMVECAIVMIVTHHRKERNQFIVGAYKSLKVPVALAKKILAKGTPIFFNEFLWAGGIAVQTQCYSKKGLEVIAGLNISNTLCNMFNIVFISLGSAVAIIVGQRLGAGEFKKAKKEAFQLVYFSAIISGIVAIVLVAIARVFPNLYDTTKEVRNLAKWFVIITACFFPLQAGLNAIYFALRSGGKTVITFLFDSVYTWVLGVTTAFVLCSYTSIGILQIFVIIQLLDIIKTIIGYALLKKGIWIQNLVEKA